MFLYKGLISVDFNFHEPQVRVVIYKDSQQVTSLKFNATGTDNLNWFSHENLIYSPWSDLKMFPSVNFGLLGPIVSDRFFEITGPYTGCESDIGWLVVTSHPVCPWDRRSPWPSIQYSKQRVASRMENYGNFDIEKNSVVQVLLHFMLFETPDFVAWAVFFLPDVVKDVKKMNEHLQKNDSGDRFKISRMGLDPFPSLPSPPHYSLKSSKGHGKTVEQNTKFMITSSTSSHFLPISQKLVFTHGKVLYKQSTFTTRYVVTVTVCFCLFCLFLSIHQRTDVHPYHWLFACEILTSEWISF